MQILRPHLRPTKSETVGWSPVISLNRLSKMVLMYVQIWAVFPSKNGDSLEKLTSSQCCPSLTLHAHYLLALGAREDGNEMCKQRCPFILGWPPLTFWLSYFHAFLYVCTCTYLLILYIWDHIDILIVTFQLIFLFLYSTS